VEEIVRHLLCHIFVWFGSRALSMAGAGLIVIHQAFWISQTHQMNCLDWTTAL